MQSATDYDIVVIGGGAGGLTAGMYAASGGMSAAVIEKELPGGQIAGASLVENYPGIAEPITGPELADVLHKQAEKFGAKIVLAEVSDIEAPADSPIRTVVASEGRITALALIIATGARARELGIPGEKEFLGKGVSRCALCDGFFFKDKQVVVIGGGNAAVQESLHLARLCRKVTLIHRRDELRADHYLRVRLRQLGDKVSYVWDSVPVSVNGDKVVRSVTVKDVQSGDTREVPCDGVFIFIGYKPNTEFMRGKLTMDEEGYIVTDELMRTSVEGIYACGDVRNKFLQQMVVACGEGATAAVAAQRYVEKLKAG